MELTKSQVSMIAESVAKPNHCLGLSIDVKVPCGSICIFLPQTILGHLFANLFWASPTAWRCSNELIWGFSWWSMLLFPAWQGHIVSAISGRSISTRFTRNRKRRGFFYKEILTIFSPWDSKVVLDFRFRENYVQRQTLLALPRRA